MAGLYAQEPLFVVTFWWGGLGFGIDPDKPYVKYCTSYAYRELTTEEFPIPNGFAYGFLKSLTGFDTTMQIDGFGQVNQLSAEFVDYFGHFRYWMASRNIYTDIMVEVGLYFRNPLSTPDAPLKGTIYKVFEGKIREPVVWNEADRTFKCDFVSDTWFKNVGYIPVLQDVVLQRFIQDPPAYQNGQQINIGEGVYEPYIDTERLLLQQNINSEVWPQLFGRATDIPLKPIAKVPEFTISDNVPCVKGWGRPYRNMVREAYAEYNQDLIPYFDNATLVIPLDENNDFFASIQRDYVDFNYTWPAYDPEHPADPYQVRVPETTVVLNNYRSMDDTLAAMGPMMTVEIETEGEIIRCAGYLIDRFFVVPPGQTDAYEYFNMPVGQNIPCEKVHQCYENPDYITWLDFNSPQAVGKLTSEERAIAAGPMPPQWVDRPDYEPNLLRLPSTPVIVYSDCQFNSNELWYDKFYKEDYDIQAGWYFVYNGNVYVVSVIDGARLLYFSPNMPDDFYIPAGTQLDFCAPDTPWLQNQFIALDVHFEWPIYNTTQATTPGPNPKPIWVENGNLTTNMRDHEGNMNAPYYTVTGKKTRQDVLYARVVMQLGPKLYIESMVNTYNMDASKWLMSPNTYVTQITVATGNLRLFPQDMAMRIQEIKQAARSLNQTGDQRRIQYVNSNVKTKYMKRDYNDIAMHYTIRANSKLRIIDWWASHTYVLTTEIGQDWENVYPETLLPLWYFRVYIEEIWANVNGRPVPLMGPKSGQVGESRGYMDHYRRNDYFEFHPDVFFIPARRDPSEMCSYYGGTYYPTRYSQLLMWPDHVSITLYPTPFMLMIQALAANNQQVELKANACNTLNSDEKIFKAVLENHTSYFYGQLSSLPTSTGYPYDPQQLTFEHQSMGVVTESMDAREFLAKVAWENAKAIQIRGNTAMLIDFFKAYNPMIIFNADNIDAKSISLEYVPFEDLITQYNVVMTNGNKWTMKAPTPFGPFDYSTLKNLAIGRDLDSWKPKDIKILLNQTFRPDDFNILEPLLDGYLKLSNLYPSFLAPQKINPLQEYFGSSIKVIAPQWIQTMPLWPVEWAERTINSVLHWWLHYESRVWNVMTFKTYVDEGNMSFYLRAGDIVAIQLDGPTVKLFEDEQPPQSIGVPALPSGYPMERINGTATNFDHSKVEYYSMNLDPAPGQTWCSGRALVLSTSLDPEEWLITVKVLLPVTADGGY
jgi:hypothetical protein